MSRSSALACFAAGAIVVPLAARAFTIETHFTASCHEKITIEALRAARADVVFPAPPPLSDDERALIGDLQFSTPADVADLAGVTLLAGVRDNDLKGESQDDLTVLSVVHGTPANQREHCLRGPGEKEPGGSKLAVADCVAFIRERVLEALGGLDAAGMPDLAVRTPLGLHLSLRGHVDAQLPLYYVRLGQAMHAVQDSFTHTYRTADGMRITVVLDWLDEVEGTLDEASDGPAHASKLDACDDPDELRKTRRLLATAASHELLLATLAPGATQAEKVAAVDLLLAKYLGYEPGCAFANGWCQAPETLLKDSKGLLGCSSAGAASGGAAALCALALLFTLRRKRGRSNEIAALLGALLVIASGGARAQAEPAKAIDAPTATSTSTTTPAKEATATKAAIPAMVTITTVTTAPVEASAHAPPAPTIVAVQEPGPKDPSQSAWGAYLGSAGSVDKTAFAFQVGGRFKASNHWTFGLDAEWNPWVTLNGYRIGSGVLNVYGAAMLRFPLAYENFNLRATVNVGGSYLLMSLYGAPAGSLGLFLAAMPAGLEWKMSRTFILVINPLGVALAAPQLKGVPLTYPQYRFSIGFEILSG